MTTMPLTSAQRQNRYYWSHRKECLERSKDWKEAHPERIREASRRHNWKTRIAALKKLGGRCVVCGVTDVRVLQINHKNVGNRHESGDGHQQFHRDIVAGRRKINDLEVRCANHNILFEYEKGRVSVPVGVEPNLERPHPKLARYSASRSRNRNRKY